MGRELRNLDGPREVVGMALVDGVPIGENCYLVFKFCVATELVLNKENHKTTFMQKLSSNKQVV